MTAWVKPGAKCVYIGVPSWARPNWQGIATPVLNHVYSIREVVPYEGSLLVRLAEIVNPVTELDVGRAERCYPIICFRPLITHTQEQDLEHFLPLLTTVEEPA